MEYEVVEYVVDNMVRVVLKSIIGCLYQLCVYMLVLGYLIFGDCFYVSLEVRAMVLCLLLYVEMLTIIYLVYGNSMMFKVSVDF